MTRNNHKLTSATFCVTIAAAALICPSLRAQAPAVAPSPASASPTPSASANPFEAAARESAPAASAASPVATTDNPFEQIARDTVSGRYFSEEVRMRIEKSPDGFGGTVRFKGKTFALEGKLKEGRLEGTFGEGPDRWPFEAQVDGDKLLYTAGEYKATLTRCRLPELKGAYESKTTRIEFLNRDDTVNGTIRINGLKYDFSTTECGGELQGVFTLTHHRKEVVGIHPPLGIEAVVCRPVLRLPASTIEKTGDRLRPAVLQFRHAARCHRPLPMVPEVRPIHPVPRPGMGRPRPR